MELPGSKTLGTIAVVSAAVFVGLDSVFRTIESGKFTILWGLTPFSS